MIEFKKLALRDKPWVDEILLSEDSESADFNFGNMYMWVKKYPQLIARFENRLLIRNCGEVPCYSFPVGTGELRPAVDALREYASDFGEKFCMLGLTDKQKAELEKEYPDCFLYRENRFFADYIYIAEHLAAYSGKSLHGKRNHCNRFMSEHEWEFMVLTRELIPQCMDMLDDWGRDNADRLEASVEAEYDAITRAFAAYEALKLDGGVLFADGQLMGFSVGEMTGSQTFDVHFEKARTDSDGVYSMVCREMTRMMMKKYPNLRYINREEDMNIESMRYSKLSYKPEYLLTKYDAEWKNE